jgi:hypothetical protein
MTEQQWLAAADPAVLLPAVPNAGTHPATGEWVRTDPFAESVRFASRTGAVVCVNRPQCFVRASGACTLPAVKVFRLKPPVCRTRNGHHGSATRNRVASSPFS